MADRSDGEYTVPHWVATALCEMIQEDPEPWVAPGAKGDLQSVATLGFHELPGGDHEGLEQYLSELAIPFDHEWCGHYDYAAGLSYLRYTFDLGAAAFECHHHHYDHEADNGTIEQLILDSAEPDVEKALATMRKLLAEARPHWCRLVDAEYHPELTFHLAIQHRYEPVIAACLDHGVPLDYAMHHDKGAVESVLQNAEDDKIRSALRERIAAAHLEQLMSATGPARPVRVI